MNAADAILTGRPSSTTEPRNCATFPARWPAPQSQIEDKTMPQMQYLDVRELHSSIVERDLIDDAV